MTDQTNTTSTFGAITDEDKTVVVGAFRKAHVTMPQVPVTETAQIVAVVEFEAQRLDGTWFPAIAMIKAGQVAPNFQEKAPHVLIGREVPGGSFEALGIFELAIGHLVAE